MPQGYLEMCLVLLVIVKSIPSGI